MLVINKGFKTYESDIRALLNSFYPGEALFFAEEKNAPGESRGPVRENASSRAPAFIDIDDILGAAARHEDRFTDKCSIKKVLYLYLSALTGTRLPWGTLTGIRPLKLIDRFRAEGYTDSGISGILSRDMLVSDKKRALLFDIKRTEDEALKAADINNTYSIYIGIPFCPTRCIYCSFTSFPYSKWSMRADEYISCLEKELESVTSVMRSSGKRPASVYIGGGTPSVLSEMLMERLLLSIEKYVDKSALSELTFEAGRPDTITADKLDVLRGHHVTRISINPQSMCQKTLELIGRRHTPEDVIRIFGLSREMGFDNINMDVIAGLPGEEISDMRHTLSEIAKLGPESLTVHALAVKRASRLNIEGNAWGGISRAGIDAEGTGYMGRMTELGAAYAAGMGMRPYYIYRQKNMAGSQENIGYAVPGRESLYNILMMEEKHTVIGIGAGASTKLVDGTGKNRRVYRFENVKNIEDYFLRIPGLIEKREKFLMQIRQPDVNIQPGTPDSEA